MQKFIPSWLVSVTLVFAFTANTHVAASCVDATDGLNAMHEQTIVLVNDEGKELEFLVKVADESFERAAGFQHICPSVIQDTLILFAYKHEVFGRFHMQNVHGPLDIAFFKGNGHLLKTMVMQIYTDDARPLYSPDAPYQFALEAAPGFFARHKIQSSRSRISFL